VVVWANTQNDAVLVPLFVFFTTCTGHTCQIWTNEAQNMSFCTRMCLFGIRKTYTIFWTGNVYISIKLSTYRSAASAYS